MKNRRRASTAPASEAWRAVEQAGATVSERFTERYGDQLDAVRSSAQQVVEQLPERLEGLRAQALVAAEQLPERVEEARRLAERLPERFEGSWEEARYRGLDAWEALHGRPRPHRRWPWATGAAVAGAVAGAAGALLWRSLRTEDAPDAQEPDEVRAVVDLPPSAPAAAPGGVVDEDGEAVHPG